ncbi:MAG: hypothetical protein LC803_00625 [Acidobacteria bacterium]|nr:hypothetical protein [Acidobacteriota bacterium]
MKTVLPDAACLPHFAIIVLLYNSHVSRKHLTAGRPRVMKGKPDDKVKVIVEMPRSLRDEALEKAQQQDVSLSQVLRMATRAFVAGRLTFSLTEE